MRAGRALRPSCPGEMPFASLIGTMNAAWPREPSSGSTVAITTWTSAMPPLVAHAFWPLMTHSPAASSNLARVRTPETSEPAFGSEAQNAATLTSSGGAEAARYPLPDLLARALAEDRRDGERGAHDRHADARVAPEQLLVDDRQRQPGRVGEELREPLEAVQPDLGGLLDDRPGGLLLLVPFVGGRPHDVGGEAVHPVADVLLVLASAPARTSPPGWLRRRSPRRPPRRPARSAAWARVGRNGCGRG